MENIRDKKLQAFEFLCDNRLGVISTLSYKNNLPQGSLVYYVVDEKFIYFITTRQSRKLANINQNNNIAFTIFTEVPPMELQIEGTVQSIDDPKKKSHISAPSMRKYRKEVAGFPNCTASPLTRISYLRSEVEGYINTLTNGQ